MFKLKDPHNKNMKVIVDQIDNQIQQLYEEYQSMTVEELAHESFTCFLYGVILRVCEVLMPMINLSVYLHLPIFEDYTKNLFNKSGLLTPNKAWEVDVTVYPSDLLHLEVRYTKEEDHAGLTLTFGLFGVSLDFMIYDTRHWNYEKNSWEEYNDPD
jgi:hypothetical protein